MKKGMACLLALMLALVSVPTAWAAGESRTALPGRWMDGEWYVKAGDVTKALGMTGEYDEQKGAYILSQTNRVSEVVKANSPAIVAIIGKPDSGSPASASRDDRYNLAHGTGFIVREDGWIMTNAHVVKGMKKLVVVTYEGKQFDAVSPYMDEESDLALVKIKGSGLPTAKLADSSSLEVGETVVAIGTPISFALRNSVSVGVVSGIDRSIHSTYRLIQTDAAINPGNSGGPLMNLAGEVIGVNSLKFAAVGVESLGFSIPVDTVRYVMEHFFKYGKVKRPSLGFTLEESWAAVVGLPTTEPLTVKKVDASSSAAKAGIKAGDLLYSVNKQNVTTLVDLNEYLKAWLPGDEVELAMQSGGDLVVRKIVLQGE